MAFGIKPMLPVVGAWSLHHWTTRKVPNSQSFVKHKPDTAHSFRTYHDSPVPPGVEPRLLTVLNICGEGAS